MKINTFSRIALLACSLGTVGLATVHAQDTAPAPAAAPAPAPGKLTPEEKAELKKDKAQVESSDAALKKESDDADALKGGDDKKAYMKAKHKVMMDEKDAIEKIDPNAAAIYAKMPAHHKPAADAAPAGGE